MKTYLVEFMVHTDRRNKIVEQIYIDAEDKVPAIRKAIKAIDEKYADDFKTFLKCEEVKSA